jgi:signal recognition particle-docking protein FtsY
MTHCAEIIESGLHSWRAECWNLETVPAFGALVTATHQNRKIFGIVYQIQTGSGDPSRTPFAYKKTELELRREQPQIFELLRTTISCITVGYQQAPDLIIYQIAPTPPALHAFVGLATPEEQRMFFKHEHFIHLIFGMAPQIISIDELLLAIIKQNITKEQHDLLMKIFETYNLLTGNDYRRLKFFYNGYRAPTMFNFIKDKLTKIYTQVASKITNLFAQNQVDAEILAQLQRILLEADTGVETTRHLIEKVKHAATGAELKSALTNELIQLLHATKPYSPETPIYLLVGINGSGKTTCAAKLASQASKAGKRVLVVAGDTFRAAAVEQLAIWAQRIDIRLVTGNEKQDPASVVYAACTIFKQENYDTIIIDTAGRLQTKTNLMHELEKIRKIIHKQLPTTPITTLLTVDSMLGQNSLDQARAFNEATQLDGIILTKMDGTGKGGIVFAIAHELKTPVAYISYGEGVEQFSRFDAENYVKELINS